MSKKKIDFKLPESKKKNATPNPQEQRKIDSWVNDEPITSSEKHLSKAETPPVKKRLSIDIDKSLHNKLKENSIYEDKTITTLVENILKKYLFSE